MRKKLSIGVGLFTAFSAVLFSCSSDLAQSETSYLPFKSSSEGKWGLIGTDGEVLFEEEFKDEPTVARNDRFMVKNGNGLWEVYTADSKPEKIGDEYLQIADFYATVTPSVKKNERINLIDVDGNVVKTLDKFNNKNIIKCSRFNFGYATITTEDDLCGIINTKGNVVIEPKYLSIETFAQGKFYATEKSKDSDSYYGIILDNTGKDVLGIKIGDGQKYTMINLYASTSKYLAVSTMVDGENQWGYIDYDKNTVIKPSSKIKGIEGVRGDKFIFYNGDNYGVMDFGGEVVLRAKYDVLDWADDNLLMAYDSQDKYYLVNLEGDKLTDEKYLASLPFYDGKHAAVKIDDNSWGFIDKNGKEVKIKNATDIYYIGENSACSVVESDFVDIDAIVARLKLDKNGLMGFGLDMMPQQIVKAYNEVDGNTNNALGLTPEENNGLDRVETAYDSNGLEITSKVYYAQYLTVTEYNSGIVMWSKEKPAYIEANVEGDKLKGKADLLYAKVAAVVKTFGKVMRENSGAVVVQVSEERGWVVTCYNNTRLYIKIFNNMDYQTFGIDSFAKVGETTKEYITGTAGSTETDAGTDPVPEINTDSVS